MLDNAGEDEDEDEDKDKDKDPRPCPDSGNFKASFTHYSSKDGVQGTAGEGASGLGGRSNELPLLAASAQKMLEETRALTKVPRGPG